MCATTALFNVMSLRLYSALFNSIALLENATRQMKEREYQLWRNQVYACIYVLLGAGKINTSVPFALVWGAFYLFYVLS